MIPISHNSWEKTKEQKSIPLFENLSIILSPLDFYLACLVKLETMEIKR